MRDELASLDLVALVRELNVLEGARIDKVYQRGKELSIHVYKPGDRKYRLFIVPGKAFLTSYKRENPERPPGFCMTLRKHLSGQRIERVEQYDFDRVLEIHTDEKKFVAELFGQGNYILVDKGSGNILAAMESQEWSDRAIYRGETYKPPQPGTDPSTIEFDEFLSTVGSRQIVKLLAADLGLGGLYAEEILARTGIDKAARSDKLDETDLREVFRQMQHLIGILSGDVLTARIYYSDGEPEDVAPIEMQQYADLDFKKFESFSAALDTYFTEKQKAEYQRKQRKAYRQKKEELERRKEQQEQMLEGMKSSIGEKKDIGDLIYRNYGTVEEVIDTLRKARKQYSENEIKDRLESEKAEGVRAAQLIEQINMGQGTAVLDLGDDTVKIDVDDSVEENAETYYEKSKEARRKVEGAKKALEKTKEELEELEENKEDIDVSKAFKDKEKKQAEKKWYEKFRWFTSSDGFLVIGGKDQTSNDILVKKHMEKNDRYVHADFEGAPSVVIKNPDGKEIPSQTLKEAAQLAITYSQAWKMGIAADDAYHVSPDQVTKEPESGEYLPKGAFVIRGDREYLHNVETSAAVGAYNRDDGTVAMGGPESAVKKHCKHYVVVTPGKGKKSDVAKQIQRHLHDATGDDFDLDRIMRSLPPGKCDIEGKF